MHEKEPMKSLVPLSAKELLKYPQEERNGQPGGDGPVLAVADPTENMRNVSFVGCKDSHIGPKIVASHVTVQLPSETRPGKGGGRRRLGLGVFLLAALLLALALGLVFGLPKSRHQPRPPEDPISDGGDHPSDWYYMREDRNMSECDEPYRRPREALLVDSIAGSCDSPDACLKLINDLGETWVDFYLIGGRVYEGLGWNCANSTSRELRLVFLTEGSAPISQLDMYSFNALIDIGIPNEISQAYQVFPACCLDHGTKTPARGVLLFIETLATFRDRTCIKKPGNCL